MSCWNIPFHSWTLSLTEGSLLLQEHYFLLEVTCWLKGFLWLIECLFLGSFLSWSKIYPVTYRIHSSCAPIPFSQEESHVIPLKCDKTPVVSVMLDAGFTMAMDWQKQDHVILRTYFPVHSPCCWLRRIWPILKHLCSSVSFFIICSEDRMVVTRP